jgi:hypothetical protein
VPKAMLWVSVLDPDLNPDPHWIRIRWAPGSGSPLRMRIRIQKWENSPEKKEKLNLKTRTFLKISIFYATIF